MTRASTPTSVKATILVEIVIWPHLAEIDSIITSPLPEAHREPSRLFFKFTHFPVATRAAGTTKPHRGSMRPTQGRARHPSLPRSQERLRIGLA